MSTHRVWLALVAVVLALGWHGIATAEVARDVLDGSVFEGVLREMDADSGGDPDRLIFQEGRFISEACKDYGFEEADYSAHQEAGRIRFQATSTSPSHGTMVWSGVREGDRMEADVVWTKERWYWDIRREYRFEGRLSAP